MTKRQRKEKAKQARLKKSVSVDELLHKGDSLLRSLVKGMSVSTTPTGQKGTATGKLKYYTGIVI